MCQVIALGTEKDTVSGQALGNLHSQMTPPSVSRSLQHAPYLVIEDSGCRSAFARSVAIEMHLPIPRDSKKPEPS